ncbi:MAG: GntR family transcriptional regulator [Sphaerochaetaceae bacterium]|nr:GntR family transcriptional regulator [Sphaerochaetaceae bacterium]
MLNQNKKIPLYVQLYEELLDQIVSGVWEVEGLLPTEKELLEKYSVSRITVRQALEQLKNEGYIVRKPGKGTYVKSQPIEQTLSNFYSFSDDMQRKGFEIKNKILKCEKQIASDYVARKLEIELNSEVIILERIRSIDKIAFAYEKSYIPFQVCPRLTGESVEEKGLYKSLEDLGNVTPDLATETFEAILPTQKIAEYLNMNERQPALQIDRITKSGDSIIEYCRSLVRGDRIKYNVILRTVYRK